MPRIAWEDVKDSVPSQVDTQVAINHTNCPAGTDTKRRLYIKKTSTAILAYCHNCSGHLVRGVYRNHETEQALLDNYDDHLRFTKVVELPADQIGYTANWPGLALRWVWKHHVLKSTAIKYRLAWSDSWSRVILPVFNEEGECVFWQGRNVGLCGGPKYITVAGAVKPVMVCKTNNGPHAAERVVLTEDMLSAIRVAQDTTWDAIPMFGTSCSDAIINHLQTYYPETVGIHLDNDEPGGVAALALYARLRNVLYSRVETTTKHNEPKLLTPTDLREVWT